MSLDRSRLKDDPICHKGIKEKRRANRPAAPLLRPAAPCRRVRRLGPVLRGPPVKPLTSISTEDRGLVATLVLLSRFSQYQPDPDSQIPTPFF